MIDLLRLDAAEVADRPALVAEEPTATYADLLRLAEIPAAVETTGARCHGGFGQRPKWRRRTSSSPT